MWHPHGSASLMPSDVTLACHKTSPSSVDVVVGMDVGVANGERRSLATSRGITHFWQGVINP